MSRRVKTKWNTGFRSRPRKSRSSSRPSLTRTRSTRCWSRRRGISRIHCSSSLSRRRWSPVTPTTSKKKWKHQWNPCPPSSPTTPQPKENPSKSSLQPVRTRLLLRQSLTLIPWWWGTRSNWRTWNRNTLTKSSSCEIRTKSCVPNKTATSPRWKSLRSRSKAWPKSALRTQWFSRSN